MHWLTLKGRFEKTADSRKLAPIVAATDPALVQQDIAKMQLLLEEKNLQVLIALGSEIPSLLREIGRLREVTFRTVGEASGKEIDLDSYDQHYRHVVVYKPDTKVIIGAYRISFIDKAIESKGLNGVYTREFFDFDKLVTQENPNSIELGRAFANAELTDRDRRSAIYFLPLIWKGIAKVIEQNPKYTHLMGPVSISNVFSDVSKTLMLQHLMQNHASPQGSSVRPKTPFTPKTSVLKEAQHLASQIQDLNGLNTMVQSIDGLAIPSLITSYNKLGAKYLGFNFDPDFNSLDGLIVVDLLNAPEAELKKYFGDAGLEAFLRYHKRIP